MSLIKKVTFIFLLITTASAQASSELKFKLPGDSSAYFRLNLLSLIWLRYAQLGSNSQVNGFNQNNAFDIGLRRVRFQFTAQLNKRALLYFHFGENNFNFATNANPASPGNRKLTSFIHDAVCQYRVLDGANYLELGSGLTIFNGLSRFSAPGISSIMTLDVPVFAQATVDQTDEFSRKISFYVHGQVQNLHYRVVLSQPFPILSNGANTPTIKTTSSFASKSNNTLQYQTFLQYHFLDKEYSQAPGYHAGTYLGKKNVLNLEGGIIYQPNAMYKSKIEAGKTNDTTYQNLFLASIAVYADFAINKTKGTAFSGYAGYFHTDYGTDYRRFNGIMNPASNISSNPQAGNAYLMFGTGNVIYSQVGYKFKDNLLGQAGTIMPYLSIQSGKYQDVNPTLNTIGAGINLLMDGHNQKITLGWENRPVLNTIDFKSIDSRKNTVLIQYQIFM